MASNWYLRYSANDVIETNEHIISNPKTDNFGIEVDIQNWSGEGTICAQNTLSAALSREFQLYILVGSISVRLGGQETGLKSIPGNVLPDGNYRFEFSATTFEVYQDDVLWASGALSRGTAESESSATFIIGARHDGTNSTYTFHANADIGNLRIYPLPSGADIAYFDTDNSTHGTGQPIVIETVNNFDGSGINFPTDGSAWIDTGGGITPISFSGPISDQIAYVGVVFTLDLSQFYSGTETPFSYSVQTGTLPAGMSISGSDLLGPATTEEVQSGIVIRGTDQTPNTADSNTFTITVYDVPATSPTIDTVTPTDTTASVDITVSEAGSTRTEYRINGGTPVDVGTANPFVVTGLTENTTYDLEVRSGNPAGDGPWSGITQFTTQDVLNPPVGTPTIDAVTPAPTTASVDYTYIDGDATGFEYRINGGTPVDVGTANPFVVTGLTENTTYDLEQRAYNLDGDGAWSGITQFTTTSSTVTLTSDVLKTNLNIAQANTLLDYVALYDVSTGELVYRETNVTTDGSGIFTVTAAIPAATYKVDWQVNSTGIGRMPEATAV